VVIAALRVGALALVLATGACASLVPLRGEAIAPGVRYWSERQGGPVAAVVHVLEVDLSRPGVALSVSAGDRSGGMEYRAATVSEFAIASGAVAAVNGGYFSPFKGGSPAGDDFYPHSGDPVNTIGASIADGAVISPVETEEDPRVLAILCINGADVVILDGQTCAPNVEDALAAGPRLLRAGQPAMNAQAGAAYSVDRHPRTAIGLNARRDRTWLVVVDGRQPGVSEGATLAELNALFERLGASDAMNLDGGGSSAMAAVRDGRPVLLSVPIHTGVPGRERPSANHVGVYLSGMD
jgi:hypothetical protein